MSNIAVVEAFTNALISGDTETAQGHLDNEVHVSAPAGLPMGGEYIGKTSFVDFIGKLTSIYEIEIDRRRVFDTGEVVLAVIDSYWTARRTAASIRTRSVDALPSPMARSPLSTGSRTTPAHCMKSPSNPMRTGHTSEVVSSVLAA